MKKIIAYFVTILIMCSNLYAMQELNEDELKNYSNIPKKIVDEKVSLAHETIPLIGCLGGSEVKRFKNPIRIMKSSQSYDAGLSCFVNKNKIEYYVDLRKVTDDLAQNHCEQFDRNALYRGRGKGKDRITGADISGLIATLGISGIFQWKQDMIVNSYVCEKNINPDVIANKKQKEKLLSNSTRIAYLDISVQEKNNVLVITDIGVRSQFYNLVSINSIIKKARGVMRGYPSNNLLPVESIGDLYSAILKGISLNAGMRSSTKPLVFLEIDDIAVSGKMIQQGFTIDSKSVSVKEQKIIEDIIIENNNANEVAVIQSRKDFCLELGFELKTPEMGDCVLRLIEIDAQQNSKQASQNSSNGNISTQNKSNGWRTLYNMGQALQNSTNSSSGSQVCHYQRKDQQAFNTICYYSCTGTIVSHNLNSGTALCPMSINR